MLYEAFFTALIGISWGAFFLINPLTRHGSAGKPSTPIGSIDKDCFVIFYLNGMAFFILIYFLKCTSKSTYLLGFHILRRLIESSVYSYSPTSTMNFMQFATGLVYYPMLLMRSTESQTVRVPLFVAGTLLQTVLHYLLFRKKQHVKYLHYVSEMIIHSAITLDYLNLAWIISFTAINILNRNK
ncbi:hypothetical protein NEAUS03_0096 [Nematocida ausubeli]|nr:hypothetical protein NEAUS03_0096 [Nematocida ausubeli]